MFIQSKERAKELFHELIYDGLNVEVIHADRTQAQRDNIIKSFRAGRVSLTAAVFIMGGGEKELAQSFGKHLRKSKVWQSTVAVVHWFILLVSLQSFHNECRAYTKRVQLFEGDTVVLQIWILICTDLMGRGMDFKGVNMVINYDFPPSAISYIHRIGETVSIYSYIGCCQDSHEVHGLH